MKYRLPIAVALAAALAAGSASAAYVITPSASWENQSVVTDATTGLSFAAFNTATTPETAGAFNFHSTLGLSGVGIFGGATTTEVDTTERIAATFDPARSPIQITGLGIGLLFDGPEHNDEGERIRVTANLASGGTLDYTLQVWNANSLQLVGGVAPTGFSVTNLDPAREGDGGHWSLNNPFGNSLVTSFSLTAVTAAGCLDGTCRNNSDFLMTQVALVPEPSEYAMMGAGLLAVGAIVRRRRRQR